MDFIDFSRMEEAAAGLKQDSESFQYPKRFVVIIILQKTST
ncbi:MAG TPA: hypothetical protein VG847_00670 [Chitinophagaceae bacterium]|nr:hypothetical protein [Chitinophagaceae bacterium]